MTFKIEYFMYILDKFFSQEQNYACIEIDNEYKKFQENQKKEEEMNQKLEDLLDAFFFDTEDNQKEYIELKESNPQNLILKSQTYLTPQSKQKDATYVSKADEIQK